jgi:hypothetical protein
LWLEQGQLLSQEKPRSCEKAMEPESSKKETIAKTLAALMGILGGAVQGQAAGGQSIEMEQEIEKIAENLANKGPGGIGWPWDDDSALDQGGQASAEPTEKKDEAKEEWPWQHSKQAGGGSWKSAGGSGSSWDAAPGQKAARGAQWTPKSGGDRKPETVLSRTIMQTIRYGGKDKGDNFKFDYAGPSGEWATALSLAEYLKEKEHKIIAAAGKPEDGNHRFRFFVDGTGTADPCRPRARWRPAEG